MASQLYTGPIIDAHHHFWDLGLGKHPWLSGGSPDDDLRHLRQNFMPEEYRKLARSSNIVASVHVEANWDPTDPVGETLWLDQLERPRGIAERYVAYAPLLEPRGSAVIDSQKMHERVVGIRDILSWHPDPAKRRIPDNSRFEAPMWRQNMAHIEARGLSFDLLVSPWQLSDVRRLAEDFPKLHFVLNHCGSPMDRDPVGMKRWREGLIKVAAAPNVSVKVSDPVAYDTNWTLESLSEVILSVIESFGVERSMFATDFPVAGLHIGFEEWVNVFRQVVRPFAAHEQSSLFYDNANRIYKLGMGANTAT